MRRQKLTIYLSKPGLKPDECFDYLNLKKFKARRIALRDRDDDLLYVYRSESEIPSWEQFLNSGLTKGGEAELKSMFAKTFSVSGLLVVWVKKINRSIIFTLGHGRSLIRFSATEQFFGRNIILNTVAPDEILAVTTSAYQEKPRFREDQAALKTSIYDFELDLEYEILQKMTAVLSENSIRMMGVPSSDVGNRIAGYDSLHFSANLDITSIPRIYKWLNNTFKKMSYKEILPDIDSFSPVKDENLIKALILNLVKKIQHNDLEAIKVVAPGIVDYSEFHSFGIRGLGKKYIKDSSSDDFPTIETYFQLLVDSKRLDDLEIEDLSRHKILFFSSTDENRNFSVPIIKCLNLEMEVRGKTYGLMVGKWYEIEKDFYERIVKKLNSITKNSNSFVSFKSKIHKTEDGYNKAIAKNTEWQLLDKTLIVLRGKGPIEVCDLMSDRGDLIHVKLYSGSGTLSHLFSQGLVSLTALASDEQFTQKFIKKINNPSLSRAYPKKLTTRQVKIHFVIVFSKLNSYHPKKKILNLPSFSIINLYRVYKSIKKLGGVAPSKRTA